jgi:hypothetical protein
MAQRRSHRLSERVQSLFSRTRQSTVPEPDPLHIDALVVARTVRRLRGLGNTVTEMERRYEPRNDLPGIKLLIRVLRLIVEAAESELIRLSRELPTQPSTPGAGFWSKYGAATDEAPLVEGVQVFTSALGRLELALNTWKELLSEPQGRTFDPVANGYRELARRLPDPREIEFIFKPVPVLEYQVYMDVLSKFEGARIGLDRAVFRNLPRLMLMDYPAFLEGDTFQHAVIAHEFGHIALQDYEDINSLAQAPPESDEPPSGIWDWARWKAGISDGDDSHAQAHKLFVELACDHLGLRMMGPSYLLAFIEYSLAHNIYRNAGGAAHESHPHLKWRIWRMASDVMLYFHPAEIERLPNDAQAILTTSRGIIQEWCALIPGEAQLDTSLIDSAMQRLQTNLDLVIGDACYTAQQFHQDLPIVWQKLEDRIAPAEAIFGRDLPARENDADWSAPIDWRSILTGAYLRHLNDTRIDAPAVHWSEAKDIDDARAETCDFVRGAIELSQLHTAMLKMRRQLGTLEHRAQG